ncbi:hypothetical protein DL770_008640 [Monosporascus sp. CRB-9-2]|nr:hypothetical protein DL770_008640 [Monosporascus sp. CRB-9-2]
MESYGEGSQPSTPECSRLEDVLRARATPDPSGRLIIYPQGDMKMPIEIPYRQLYVRALQSSTIIRNIRGFNAGHPILLHMDGHWDAILWFWAVLLAGGVPVLSTPFSNTTDQRRKHISDLSALLESPICITRAEALVLFDCDHNLRLHSVESLLAQPMASQCTSDSSDDNASDDTAMLMLTSGSTASPKAVAITHEQALAAVVGKSSVRALPRGRPFLNWIGLSHVASLIEIHLQALWLGVDQVHVHTAAVVASPRYFLDLLSRHGVATSFAPNFFLAKLVDVMEAQETSKGAKFDLSNLTVLASGGEANDMKTCLAVSTLLSRYGAPKDVLVPGFGMTETCAGAIFNLHCPAYDIAHHHDFASLGRCMRGIEMRVVTEKHDGEIAIREENQPGDLQVRGSVVFKGYFRNSEATAKAFTRDGWFRTGDQGVIDEEGSLRLMGRTKDVMNINGVKVSGAHVQAALDQALGDRVAHLIAFPSRTTSAPTEQVTVAYVPHRAANTASLDEDRYTVDTNDRIVEAVLLCAASSPVVFAVPDESYLQQSVLGKTSRAKMRSLFEAGVFSNFVEAHRQRVEGYRALYRTLGEKPATNAEVLMLADFANVMGIKNSDTIGVKTPIWDLGCTSMDLIKLNRRVSFRLQIDVPIITLIRHPTVQSLATELDKMMLQQQQPATAPEPYDPVATFCGTGHKTPLWLFHPGVGDVLVFVGLAQQLADTGRPIYALRARGFERGQPRFASIAEAVSTYHGAIRRVQPSGPYALSGYSYGAMLAFETAKMLESEGAEVCFLASFNLPPHIGTRMRQLTWPLCLLHLAHFLGLCSEDQVERFESLRLLCDMSRSQSIQAVLGIADATRLEELGLDEVSLAAWADVAYGLQHMAVGYEPRGSVGVLDVFHAIPLKAVGAKSRLDWLDNYLGKWRNFCSTEVRFHSVPGTHYTMIDPEHVAEFSRIFKEAMKSRGL